MIAEPRHDALRELEASRQAMLEGRFQDADNHLRRAAQFGAEPSEVNTLGQEISYAVKHHNVSAVISTKWALGVGVVAYLFLSLQQPLDWGMSVWIGLAFLAIPAIMGIIIGRGHGSILHIGIWFWKAWWSAGAAMSGYTMLNLILLRSRFGDSGDTLMLLLIGILAAVVFGCLTGLASGLISVMTARLSNREAIHGAAH